MISGYGLREKLFESRHSLIYRAVREADGRLVVLKLVHAEYPTSEQLARSRYEFRMTRQARGEGVIEALALEEFRNGVALVLEDFAGRPLSELLGAGPLELRRFLDMAARLAEALGGVHQRRIIHKDLNPSNILYNPDTDTLKLIDFGISTELSREVPTQVGPRVLEGTLPYISPEQTGRMNRAIDYRTDLYSLGVTLYQLVTGRLPFTAADPMGLVHAHIAQVPVPPHELVPAVPVVVSNIILRLLAKRAEERYQSAFTLRADLARCLERLDGRGDITEFPIGCNDVPDVLRLPQRLHGRERETQLLLEAFERVASGGKELLLVAGYSGIGKSALVHELHRPIVERRGYFISGKFDQFNRDIPYASLIQAVQELVRQLLTEPAEELAWWKERLLEAVGANGQLIIDVIHEVALVIGEQPPVPELSPTEAQNRFNLTFERFFRVFADAAHPLAIFLDDLQWADLPSLRLLERLMTDAETRHLLLMGAYRDNEVDAGHPLLVTVEAMREQGARVGGISLSPLGREDVIGYLVDTLQCGRDEVVALAELCLKKTGGNPFFLGQFLLSLHERGELRYDTRPSRWQWDDARISRMEMTDNVVDLMAGRIRGLAEPVQHTLRVAACIGNVFDLQTLAVGLGVPAAEAATALWPALKEGLVLPLDGAYRFAEEAQGVTYRFLHDRVQQAAYSLIPPELRGALHLQVGRLLLRGASEAEREERLFSLVGHLNAGSPLIEAREERDALAELNLAAARKAKASTAYAAAMSYLQKGIALLGEDGFQRRHALAIELHLQAAEVSYLNKEFNRIDLYAREVLAHDEDVLLRVKVAEIRIQAFNAQNKLGDAVHTALGILEVLGVRFPDTPTEADLLKAVGELDAALAGRPIGALLELPALTDPVKVAVLRILATTIPTSYLYDPRLFPLLAVRQVAYSVAHGNAGPSASGYASWAIILCGALGRIDDGYEFGKLASRVLARYDARNYEARTEYIVSCYIAHHKEHVRRSVQAFKDIYRTGLETGDLDFASYSLVSQATQLYLGGVELAQVEQVTASSIPALVQLRHEPALNYTRAVRQVVHNLMGRVEEPTRLVGEAYDEETMLAFHQEARDSYGLGSAYLWKLQLSFLFGRRAEALKHADALRTQLNGLVGQFQVPTALLFGSLAVLANLPDASLEMRGPLLARVEGNLERLKMFAAHAPMNHAHKYALVRAERARVLGEPEKARELYYQAMALAHENEYRNEEALAAELFSEFASSRGELELAGLFLEKAHHLYGLWGAKAKVQELERRHPELAAVVMARHHARRMDTRQTDTVKELESVGSALDLLSVLKASQALSGEVHLEGLLKKLMGIVLENAGARRGLLMVEGESALGVVAGPGGIELVHEPVEQREDVSQAIVRYVHRTHQAVVLGDAAKSGAFISDAYVARHRPKSVLCQPILHQKKLVGILYLENELVSNAFSPQLRQVLELLSAQAAISIENAKLYETLDSRVKARTRELSDALERLKETQRQLVVQEKLASLGMLTSGIAHELKNPLNFVNNFADLSVKLGEELVQEFTGQKERLTPSSYEYLRELVQDLRQNAVKIHEHGRRADGIVKAMLQHSSRPGTGQRQPVDVNGLVRQYTVLALQGRGEGAASGVKLETHYDESLGEAEWVADEIGRVIINLLENALHAVQARKAREGEGYTPVISVTTRAVGDRMELRVRDNGTGIPVALRERIFSPFFTTKAPGKGTGLGLSLSHNIIVQANGGTLTFESEEGRFTEFVVTLPRKAPPPASAPQRTA
ncbi:MAG TPA: AAA family ATPase [Archangium sp.]|uniref:trifunctional serine/threonine-protein kinase/ATP-binding protein/sensor histidine kinase n=1 Tax=Archangium sp. TaxID=1872627 RepID=UPI002E3046B2|nr:AAA family ATPase [Archangium sp.]HEX5750923.1 AAA family ATPase [Archangium sp.]